MTPLQALDRTLSRFHYQADSKLDRWRIHKEDGPFSGDCEDFALTLLWELSDRSMWKFWWNLLTFQAVIWHVTSFTGGGHAVLWYHGRWADNMALGWYTTNQMRHIRRFPYLLPMVLMKFVIAAIARRFG